MKKNTSKSNLLSQPFKVQPGLLLGVLGLVIMGGGVILNAGASDSTTMSACKPVPVQNISTAHPADNQVDYTVSPGGQGGTTTAVVKAGAKCVGTMISLVSYQTTAANGLPRDKQTLFDSQTKPLSPLVNLSVKVPPCFYQVDLAYGHPLDLTTGEDYSSATNFLWGVVGGTKSCIGVTPSPTPRPTATPVPSSSVHPTDSDTPRPSVSVHPTPSPTDVVEATDTPEPSDTPTDEDTPTPSPTNHVTPSATPTVIPLNPGQTTPPTVTTTSVLGFLPQTGTAGSLMTYLGALLVTAGLFHIYLSQRRKLLKKSKLR